MNFHGRYFAMFYGGLFGRLRIMLGMFQPAALGRKLLGIASHAPACDAPYAPISDPIGSVARTATASARIAIKAPSRRSPAVS